MAKLRFKGGRFWLAFTGGFLLPLSWYGAAMAQSSDQAAQPTAIGLLVTTLLLGIRHGSDWDHIAAITDITGSASARSLSEASSGSMATIVAPMARQLKRGLKLSTAYAVGHGVMVILLGILAIAVRAILPSWVDPLMSSVVGLTLILLGLALLVSIWHEGEHYQFRSRWMVTINALHYAQHWIAAKIVGSPMVIPKQNNRYSLVSAFCVGLLHGVGAETGTQVTLIGSVAGVNSGSLSLVMLLTFTGGILVSNTLIALLTASGFVSFQKSRKLYLALGLSASIFSLVVGTAFLLQRDSILPDLQELFKFIS